MKFFTRKKQEIERKKGTLKKFSVASIFATGMTFLCTSPVFAEETTSIDVSGITTGLNNISSTIALLGYPICLIAVVVAGIAFPMGQKGREFAKTTLFYAFIGGLVVTFAVAITNIIFSFK